MVRICCVNFLILRQQRSALAGDLVWRVTMLFEGSDGEGVDRVALTDSNSTCRIVDFGQHLRNSYPAQFQKKANQIQLQIFAVTRADCKAQDSSCAVCLPHVSIGFSGVLQAALALLPYFPEECNQVSHVCRIQNGPRFSAKAFSTTGIGFKRESSGKRNKCNRIKEVFQRIKSNCGFLAALAHR